MHISLLLVLWQKPETKECLWSFITHREVSVLSSYHHVKTVPQPNAQEHVLLWTGNYS